MEKNILTISINKKELAEIIAYAMKAYQEMNRNRQKEEEREKIENIKVPEEEAGFYSFNQLYKEIFPWSKTKLERMIRAGEFPKPVKGPGQARLWPKKVIREYIEKIKGGEHETKGSA